MHQPTRCAFDREPALVVDLGRDGARRGADLDDDGGVVTRDPAVDPHLVVVDGRDVTMTDSVAALNVKVSVRVYSDRARAISAPRRWSSATSACRACTLRANLMLSVRPGRHRIGGTEHLGDGIDECEVQIVEGLGGEILVRCSQRTSFPRRVVG